MSRGFSLFEKHSFSNRPSIETTLSIEFAENRNFLFDARYAQKTFFDKQRGQQ